MKSVKFLVLITIGMLFKTTGQSQVKLPITDNQIRTEMEKVVKDYFNQFTNIRGEEIADNPQSTDYKSTVTLNGSEECSITKYSSKKNNVWSWQAVMLTTEEFAKAKRNFQSLFNQLNNLSVSFESQPGCLFKGNFSAPTEAKKFTSVVFSADSKDEALKPLKIELTLEYKIIEWQVKIVVYGKEREDNEPASSESSSSL
jgi:hypothetical protein